MDLNLKPFSSHGSFAAAIPFFVFVAVAVVLQYFQMAQMNNRNKKTGQAMPSQQQAMQRFLPIIFAYFYIVIPAAVVLYMIISTVIRIITQDLMFRAGVSNPHKNGVRSIPAPESKEIEVEGKPSTIKPQGPPKSPAKPPAQPKPQPQSRSKAKRKRKAR